MVDNLNSFNVWNLWHWVQVLYYRHLKRPLAWIVCAFHGHRLRTLYRSLGCPTANIDCGEKCIRCGRQFLQVPILTATQAGYLAYHLNKEQERRLDEFAAALRKELT